MGHRLAEPVTVPVRRCLAGYGTEQNLGREKALPNSGHPIAIPTALTGAGMAIAARLGLGERLVDRADLRVVATLNGID